MRMHKIKAHVKIIGAFVLFACVALWPSIWPEAGGIASTVCRRPQIFLLNPPTIHNKKYAQGCKQGLENQQKYLVQSWVTAAKNSQRHKAGKKFEHKTLV